MLRPQIQNLGPVYPLVSSSKTKPCESSLVTSLCACL